MHRIRLVTSALESGFPITGIAVRRAPAATGHVAAAPPSSVMTSRRLIR